MSGATRRLAVLAAMACLWTACALGHPKAPRTTVVLETPDRHGLAGARSIWVAAASSRLGAVASGLEQPAAAPAGAPEATAAEDLALARELGRAIDGARRLELASARGDADLVLYFERADRLHCFRCRQAEGVWYWWALVLDPAGREVASLHGETEDGADDTVNRCVRELRKLTRGRAR